MVDVQAVHDKMQSETSDDYGWFGRTFDPTGYEAAVNREESDKDRDFNAEQAERNRQFQLNMSNTAYQRAVADLKKAGLNPYLAYGQGGASSPSGTSASAGSGRAVSAGANGQVLGTVLSALSSAFSLGVSAFKAGAAANKFTRSISVDRDGVIKNITTRY